MDAPFSDDSPGFVVISGDRPYISRCSFSYEETWRQSNTSNRMTIYLGAGYCPSFLEIIYSGKYNFSMREYTTNSFDHHCLGSGEESSGFFGVLNPVDNPQPIWYKRIILFGKYFTRQWALLGDQIGSTSDLGETSGIVSFESGAKTARKIMREINNLLTFLGKITLYFIVKELRL